MEIVVAVLENVTIPSVLECAVNGNARKIYRLAAVIGEIVRVPRIDPQRAAYSRSTRPGTVADLATSVIEQLAALSLADDLGC